jgi:hypothetical protein
MSVRSFRPVFMAGGVAAAALSCYLVSLRVASERAALEGVETKIVLAQRDIRLLQTEIGTRGRLAQLERWNVKVLALSAPSVDQFVPDSFQLARLVAPEQKPAVEAPVVYASAPTPSAPSALPPATAEESAPAPKASLMHEASLKVSAPASTAKNTPPPKAAAPATVKKAKAAPVEKPRVKVAKADPLAPLTSAKTKTAPAAKPVAAKPAKATTSKDSGKTR